MAFDTAQFDIVFDKLTSKVKTELTEQYNAKRILGNEYAEVYSRLMERALQLAYGDQDTQADIALKETQKLLYARQTKGFNDNVKQKLFDSQVNSWGLMFSSGMLEEKPSFITNNAVTTLYNDIIASV